MTPDQLKYLTDEERRAWEACGAATPGPWDDELDTDRKAERNNWREVYAGNRPVVVSDCYERHSAGETETVCGVRVSAPDAALIALSRTALPAALEALADARAARDVEEQLRCVADDERARAERDAEDARRERDEARARLAKLGKAALTLLSVLDVHEDATEGRELADGVYADTYHPDHADAVYEAKSALRAASVHTPGEDPAPHGAGAPDASGGASGVGVLTNCDSCRHDYVTTTGVHEVHGCRRLDNDDADFDAVSEWSFANCNTRRDARPDPGATGCPGWAKMGEG